MERSAIRRLPPELARKIAAGEVIERPASVVRELMENSIDSGAGAVSVSITSGGIDSIRVSDDGCGIARADMESVAMPHATSKIASEDDLLSIGTLGFRGEALSSMAAVADLEILSATDGSGACKYFSRPGRPPSIEPAPGKRGTSVTVDKLFERFPARKRFLKRPATETTLAVQTFIDRALPHPGIEFRLNVDSRPRLLLPVSSQKARVLASYSFDEPESLYHEIEGKNGDFSYTLVFGSPQVRRLDRRHLQCFVNGRRVQDFSLQKSLEAGFTGFLPGGAYPVAFLFLRVDPASVDFNIHPAKKELRFRDPSAIQSGVVRLARTALSSSFQRMEAEVPPYAPGMGPSLDFGAPVPSSGPYPPGEQSHSRFVPSYAHEDPRLEYRSLDALRAAGEGRPSPRPGDSNPGFTLLGQCLGVFILFERYGELYALDQHAAHERILFDALQAKRAVRQELLVPYVFETESDADADFLASHAAELAESGYAFEHSGNGAWALLSHPEGLRSPLSETVREILSGRGSKDLRRSLNAMTACRCAIKDGEKLDSHSMSDLVERSLSLPEPRCPHGRPIWTRISREELYKRVMRVVG